MKVLFVMPGAGDAFYCGNCFRDNLQAMSLRKAGHEVVVVPLYLPVQQSGAEGGAPLFFPATTYYIEQKLFGRRRMPSWLSRERYDGMAMARVLAALYASLPCRRK